MAENTAIEWCDHTFNPWEGCQKAGPGCDNCYAEARDQRFTGGRHWGPGAPRRRTSPSNWHQPVRWNLRAATEGRRPRVFCASLADVFDNAVPPEWREDLFRLIASTPHLDWLLLTKRPGNIAAMLPFGWGAGWHNVWLGCTVVNQTEADRDIPKLLAVPAAVRFLSMEPLLGPVDLCNLRRYNSRGEPWINALRGLVTRGDYLARSPSECSFNASTKMIPPELPRIDWVIVGGESGPNARPMHPDWARSIRDQCQAAGVPFLFKQWGENAPEEIGPEDVRSIHYPPGHVIYHRIGKRAAGRLLDGREWTDFPDRIKAPEGA